jgi:hypothetical protein
MLIGAVPPVPPSLAFEPAIGRDAAAPACGPEVIELTCMPLDFPAAPVLPGDAVAGFMSLPAAGFREQSQAENCSPPSKHVCRPTDPFSQVQRQTSPGTHAFGRGVAADDSQAASKRTTPMTPLKEVALTSPSRH